MFHKILAPQGFSFCNRARLNFQAFALRHGMKIFCSVNAHQNQFTDSSHYISIPLHNAIFLSGFM